MFTNSIASVVPGALTCLRARWVVPVATEPIETGAVVVQNGRILDVGGAAEVERRYPEAVNYELGESAILPGLVNAHSHLELTAMRGLLEHADFREWITTLTDVKMNRLSADDLLDSARLGVLEAMQAGITTCADTCDSGFAMNALVEAGLGGIVYQEVFGPDPRQAVESMAKLADKVAELVERCRGSNVAVGVSPHAPYTVSSVLFRDVAEYARERRISVAIHAAESESEERLVLAGEGPFAERFAARGIEWNTPGTSTIAYLDRLGVLEVRPLLIHAVRATDADLDAVARSRSTLVHCPKSNAKFGHGVARVSEMRRRHIPVGLGTDSVASNNVCDILDEGRVAVLSARASECNAKALSARDAIEMATIDGARALRLETEIGSLEPGKRADLCSVSLSGLHASPVYDVETAIVFSASRHDIQMTMAAGRVVYLARAEERPGLDDERLRARLGEIHRRIQGC